MWKLRYPVILGSFLAVFIIGAASVYAGWGWGWKAQVDVEGADVRTQWAVTDGNGNTIEGEQASYHAKITIKLPQGADASLIGVAEAEDVTLKIDDELACTANGVEAKIQYKVSATGAASGDSVETIVTANGQPVSSASGRLNAAIKHHLVVPVSNPSCYDAD